MVQPFYNFQHADDQLATIGRIMVTFSHIEFHLNDVLTTLRSRANRDELPHYPTEQIGRKLREAKKLLNRGLAPEVAELWNEFRLAMAHALPARNMIAHGILLYDEKNEISFWSQSRRKELPLLTVMGAEKWANYGLHVSFHAYQHLHPSPFDGEVKLPKPLPDRPQ